MKQIHKLLPLLFIIFFTFGNIAYSQPRPPSDHDQEGDYSPKPLPIGSGITMLMLLGAAYGAGKVYHIRKRETP